MKIVLSYFTATRGLVDTCVHLHLNLRTGNPIRVWGGKSALFCQCKHEKKDLHSVEKCGIIYTSLLGLSVNAAFE